LRALDWKNVDIFYGHLEYFKDIWESVWPFGAFCVDLVHFPSFGITCQQKSGDPGLPSWECKWEKKRWVEMPWKSQTQDCCQRVTEVSPFRRSARRNFVISLHTFSCNYLP
jgi:hypothetical protein